MAHVSALYRYPVKGFTPEPVESLTIQPDGRVAGDRVLAFRFGNAAGPEDQNGLDYWPKAKGLALQDFPSLAPLRLKFHEQEQRITVSNDGRTIVDVTLDDAGRDEFRETITEFVLASAEGSKLSREGRLPLVLVGDGEQARFQDRPRGYVTVHASSSAAAIGEALGMEIDNRRFRSNVVIEGLEPNEELQWQGTVRIGEVSFDTQGPIVRCLATHANPDTGERDAPVMKTLTGALGMAEPCIGRLLLPTGVPSAGVHPGTVDTGFAGGVIRIGDPVTVN